MIILVKYTPLTVRKCMSAQNYQSRKGKTCIFKNISLDGLLSDSDNFKYCLYIFNELISIIIYISTIFYTTTNVLLFSLTSRAEYFKMIVFHVVLRAETKYYPSKCV